VVHCLAKWPAHFCHAADGACDQDGVYGAVADRHPEAEVIVPPRITAIPGSEADTAPTGAIATCDLFAENGRMAWQWI
jgi:hypothetical protein